jgi:hypothetical protein
MRINIIQKDAPRQPLVKVAQKVNFPLHGKPGAQPASNMVFLLAQIRTKRLGAPKVNMLDVTL